MLATHTGRINLHAGSAAASAHRQASALPSTFPLTFPGSDMSDIQRLHTNARMSQVVIANGIVHLAGQVPDIDFKSITEQTNNILTRIDTLLAEAGVDKARLLTANIWLTDAKHFAELNAAWEAWVPAGHAPTRACVQSGLMRPGIDVEIAVTALAKG